MDRSPLPHQLILRRVLHAPVVLYRCRCGWMLGYRFLLLIHTGRRTGRRRETVLEVLEWRPQTQEAIVLSGFGRNAGWLRNIQANPHPTVMTASRRFVASMRVLEADEAVAVFTRYEQRNRFVRPIIRVVLSRLLGWSYDGSDTARRRLAEQLPFVGFRPAVTAGSEFLSSPRPA